MKRELLLLLTTLQITIAKTAEGSCDARSESCHQMSEPLETPDMGQHFGSKSHKEKEPSFPGTLEEFGYKFNKDGEMRNIETDEPFEFVVKEGDRSYNQKHYEALGEVITEHVYKLLEEDAKLKRVFVPIDAKENEGQSFIFMSENAMTANKLMILIHGSGVVRAGQWARRIIINNDLKSGTMLPYIKRASQEGYGVLITNGNQNHVKINGKKVPVKGSRSPEEHFLYVWDNFVSKAAAESIVVVAHSYGGIVIVEGLVSCKEAMDRVKAVAFTDSVHSLPHQGAKEQLRQWMKKNSRNWVSSDLPLDTPVSSMFYEPDCERVSAGTPRHELTSYTAFGSVFKFFAEKLGVHEKEEKKEIEEKEEKKEIEEKEEKKEIEEKEEKKEIEEKEDSDMEID